MSQFLTYAKFYSEEETEELATFLSSNNIPHTVEQEKNLLDKIYVGDSLDPMFSLKINETDFTKVNDLIINNFSVDVAQVAPDYYLLTFSSDELRQVINNPNEWNYYDRALAVHLLAERNDNISVNVIIEPQQEYKPDKIQMKWIILEYLIAIILSYAGIIIGLATLFAKRTLKNGQSVNMYDDSTRSHGTMILLIGIIRSCIFYFF